MSYIPKVTDEDLKITEREIGETAESRKKWTVLMADHAYKTDPGIDGFLAHLLKFEREKPWFSFTIYALMKVWRTLQFAYSRSFPPDGAILPPVSPEVGGPLRRDSLRQPVKFWSRRKKRILRDNPVLFRSIGLEAIDASMFLTKAEEWDRENDPMWDFAGEVLDKCTFLYCMIESQLEANHLKDQFA